MVKLIVVIMGPGKKHFAEMCLDSVKDADEILYWTNNKNSVKSFNFMESKGEIGNLMSTKVFDNEWDEKDTATNGKCRQRYLEYLKKNHPNDWALVLDEDEILHDDGIRKIKKFIINSEVTVFDVHMRHFINNLGREDAAFEKHWVPKRLFKISEAIKYPEHSHPVLEATGSIALCDCTTIWHLGHLPIEYMDYISKRYKQHAKDSIIHTQKFLEQWRDMHLFGLYPTKQINPKELPKQICDRYSIDKDRWYFTNRGLEVKHFIMTKQWKNYFNNKNVLDCGCGRGPYLCAWNVIDVEAFGFDKSKFAVMNPINANTQMMVGDILDEPLNKRYDLVTVIDILEHLEYEDLSKALENIKAMTNKHVLFSIPFIGDPNLDTDSTHIIRETKEWWIDKLSEYFDIKKTPSDWMFAHQLIVGEKK